MRDGYKNMIEWIDAECNMCNGLGHVAKITYPITLYYKTGKGNERKLMPKYNEIWICDDCRLELIEILKGCGE